MNDTEQAFLRAVIAQPDDDLPRLILCDWWEEHGQLERAEFCRVQCRIAVLDAHLADDAGDLFRCPSCGGIWDVHYDHEYGHGARGHKGGCEVDTLRRRSRTLWAKYGVTWLVGTPMVDMDSLTPADNRVVWCRGFVEEVTMPWNHAHIAAIRRATPLRRVVLTEAPLGLNDWRHFRTSNPRPGIYYHEKFPGIEFELLDVRPHINTVVGTFITVARHLP